VSEQCIQFGPRGGLIGTVTEPEPGGRRNDGLGLLLLNAGLVHRVGPHRINVKLARLAARRGIPSIRFDLSGRGDSGPGERGKDFRAQAVSDIRAALSELEARGGTRRYMIFGICSGADDGFAAALNEPRIASLVLFDPYVFPTLRWKARVYASKLRKYGLLGGLAYWRDLRAAKGSYEDSVLANYGREIPPIGEFANAMQALCDRGVAIRLVYSASSVDQRDFATQCRMLLDGHGLSGRVQADFLPDVDHVVTSVSAQRRVLEKFDGWAAGLPGAP